MNKVPVQNPSSNGWNGLWRLTQSHSKLLYLLAALVALSFASSFSYATTFPAPGVAPSGLAFDGTFLYVSELRGFRTIFRLDPETGAVKGSFLAPSSTGLDGRGNPNDMVYGGANRLFVSDIGNFGTGIVYEIDTAGTTIFRSFPLPFRGGAIAFDGTQLYIADHDSSQIRVTDRFGTLIRTFNSGLRPAGMVYNPASGHLNVISQFDKMISEITTNGSFIGSRNGPRDPGVQGLGAITIVGAKFYLAEVSDPDPFIPPDVLGTIFIIDQNDASIGKPVIAQAVTLDGGMLLLIAPPTGADAKVITGYHIEITGDQTITQDTIATNDGTAAVIIRGLRNGFFYTVKVFAVDAQRQGLSASTIDVVPQSTSPSALVWQKTFPNRVVFLHGASPRVGGIKIFGRVKGSTWDNLSKSLFKDSNYSA